VVQLWVEPDLTEEPLCRLEKRNIFIIDTIKINGWGDVKKFAFFFLNYVKTTHMSTQRSPRRQLKVGPSQAPKPNCPPGEYAWRNYFKSGCDPAQTDRRRLALQFRAARGARELPFAGEQELADGWDYGSGRRNYRRSTAYNGRYDQDWGYGYASPSRRSRSPRRY
jgi:hypothetical protein